MRDEIVLVIEDQKSIALYLQQRLSLVCRHTVLIAGSGAEAKSIIDSGVKIVACMTDLNLPDCEEGGTVTLLQEHHIPTVVLTASYSDEMRQKMFAQRVADYVIKDGQSAIDYAVGAVVRLVNNANKMIWLLAAPSKVSNRLLGLLKIQRYPVRTFESCKAIHKALDSGDLPNLILLEGVEKVLDESIINFISTIRSDYSTSQLPMILCEPTENISLAIKLMKYGVNDFYNINFSAEELYVRINQNIDQTEAYQEIERISQTDALTQLFNRGYFFRFGEDFFESLIKENSPFFVVMADIDHFKLVNDNYGHQKGDEAIIFSAQTMSTCFKGYTVARFGGEEFCVLGKLENKASILKQCEDFREKIETNSYELTGVKFTASVGIAFEGETLEKAIHYADSALYRAKESGRNQVIEYKA